jgi:cysteine-rich repeat protein
VCGATCAASFANCDANLGNGCETNTSADNANCGGCGVACTGDNFCYRGACVTGTCVGGSNLLSRSPGRNMILCDHPSDAVCEQDFGTLCPPTWHLCTRPELVNRNAGWSYVSAQQPLGAIYCRNGGGAGHYTANWSSSGPMSSPSAFNCGFGTSQPACPTGYGCNEQSAYALCCAPNPLCGNGVVDSVEEQCDDANTSDSDECLTNCTWRTPVAHGVTGPSC